MNRYTLWFSISDLEKSYLQRNQSKTVALATVYFILKILLNILQFFVHASLFGFSGQFKMIWYALEYLGWTLMTRYKPNYIHIILSLNSLSSPLKMILDFSVFDKQHFESIPEIFHLGSESTINMITLLLLTPEFIRSFLTFTFTCSVYLFYFTPPYFDYNYASFITGILWISYIKYSFEKYQRQRYILQEKDQQWSDIIERNFSSLYINLDMKSWVAIVKFDQKNHQVVYERINQNFKFQFKIEDNKIFRKFLRSIRVKRNRTKEKYENLTYKISTDSQRYGFLKNQDVQQLPTLEDKINELLNLSVEKMQVAQKKMSLIQEFSNEQKQAIFVKELALAYTGISYLPQIDLQHKYYSLQLQAGYDNQPFVVLFVDKDMDSNSQLKLKEKYQILQMFIEKKYASILLQLISSFSLLKGFMKEYKKKLNPRIAWDLQLNQSSLLLSIIHQQNFLLYLAEVENFLIPHIHKYSMIPQSFNIINLINYLKQLFASFVRIEVIGNLFQNDQTINQSKWKVLSLLVNFLENVWKHNKEKQYLVIEVTKLEQSNVIKITLRQKKFPHIQYKYLLGSYKITKFGIKKVKIIDEFAFNTIIRYKQKIGWLINQIHLSDIGPSNKFNIEQNGNAIHFEIYQNLECVL